MAHSTVTIPSSPDKSATRKSAGAHNRKAQSRTGASFAALMAKEQINSNMADGPVGAADKKASSVSARTENTQKQAVNATASQQKKPVVARLPGAETVFQNAVLAGRTPSDLLRAHGLSSTGGQAMGDYARNMVSGASTLNISRGAAGNLKTIAAANNGKGFALTSNDFIHTLNIKAEKSARTGRSRKSADIQTSGLGKLSAKFESGGAGISAIGYDRTGGTSYGKYQIASKVGSMKSFLNFLDSEAPDLSKRLRSAGPANTGSRSGAMPNEWRAIAKEQPERFERLQESYIMETHYKPALSAIEQSTGVDASSLSTAMREVIWSTAVQHGPAGAARIFSRADGMSGKSSEAAYERNLIKNVYTVRATQFGSSTNQVRNAVLSRFREERQLALNLLDGAGRASLA